MLQTCVACQSPSAGTVEDFVQSCADALIPAVALDVVEQGVLNLDSDEAVCRRVAELFASAHVGIPIAAVTSSLYRKHSFASSEAESRDLARQITEALIYRAAWLGAPLICVSATGHFADNARVEMAGYEQVMRSTQDALSACAEQAERMGIMIAVVVPAWRFLLSPLEVRDLLDRLNSPMVGAALHLDAVTQIGYPTDWLRILAYRTRCLLRTGLSRVPAPRAAAEQLDAGLSRALREVRFAGPLICTSEDAVPCRQ